MATWEPAGTDIGRSLRPDLAIGGTGKPVWTEPDDWSLRVRWARRRALAETSAAFTAGGLDIGAICSDLADRLVKVLHATCLVRPLEDGVTDLPVAFAQARDGGRRDLTRVVVADPHALAAACSARAVELGRSILLPELSVKCLRLWSRRTAWALLDELEIRSMLVAPVCTSTRPVGTIVVWRQQADLPLQEDEQLFVEEVARRLAWAHAQQRGARAARPRTQG